MPLVDLSGTYAVTSQETSTPYPTEAKTSEESVLNVWAKGGAPRPTDGLAWPTGVQRFGKAPVG